MKMLWDEINTSIGKVKHIVLCNVGGLNQHIQLAEGLKRKKTTVYQPLSKKEFPTRLPLDFIYNTGFSCLMALELAHLQTGPKKPS